MGLLCSTIWCVERWWWLIWDLAGFSFLTTVLQNHTYCHWSTWHLGSLVARIFSGIEQPSNSETMINFKVISLKSAKHNAILTVIMRTNKWPIFKWKAIEPYIYTFACSLQDRYQHYIRPCQNSESEHGRWRRTPNRIAPLLYPSMRAAFIQSYNVQ